MANRTQIVCLHEGKGGSIDAVFINRLIRCLKPAWLRPWGSNIIRLEACGGRRELVEAMPDKLRQVLDAGGNTTLMVWADLDHDMPDCNALEQEFRKRARNRGITDDQFNQVVFAFAKDRLENWIEFLLTGATDETREAPRVKHDKEVAEAARRLAESCLRGSPLANIPSSLRWSCDNWRKLVDRMRS